MPMWKPEAWERVRVIVPRIGVWGEIIWGECERRLLTNRVDDGLDHLRDVAARYQYRRLDHDWPKGPRRAAQTV